MSWTPERRQELAWGAFFVACAAAMLAFPAWQTVPFHWIWITLTFLYGFRRWTNAQTTAVLAAVSASTAAAMLLPGGLGDTESRAELTEIPLMACVFLGMVWHVRRRQDAIEEQRRIADREREFMRDAAHTLRTPLTVAQGHAELLLDGLQRGTAESADAGVLLDELRRLSRISNQLLMLGSAPSEDLLLVAPVRLDEIARTVATRWSPASERDVVADARGPVYAWGDEERLRDAVEALVENAVHATEPGQRIVIAVRVDDGRAVIEVSDEGRGIGPQDVPRVLERFGRGTGAVHPGTGLGLAIVQTIAETHGGDVRLRSEPGAGTAVAIRLGAPAPPAVVAGEPVAALG